MPHFKNSSLHDGLHRVELLDIFGHVFNLVGEVTAKQLQSNHHRRFTVTTDHSLCPITR